MEVWLVGFGGLGKAIYRRLLQAHGVRVNVVSRRKQSLPDVWEMDVSCSTAVHHLADGFSQRPPQVVIVTAGALHDDTHSPEKTLRQCCAEQLQARVVDNVLPTLHVAQALQPWLTLKHTAQLVAFSARVGSMSDNRLGGWYSYRMSKAMLNMLIKTVAVEWRVKSPGSHIIGYHPGTVETSLSAPFIGNQPRQKRFSPTQAAQYFYDVLEQLQAGCFTSGCVVDWQGQVVAP